MPSLKQHVPWWAKVGLKVALSRVPMPYSLWRKAGLFVHGTMESPSYAHDVFLRHFERTGLRERATPFTCLEVGPGDSLFSALTAKAHGAERTWLVDAGAFARDDLQPYRTMAEWLRSSRLPVPDLAGCMTVADVLDRCNATYLTQGLASMRTVPSASVDWIWSQAVLEHIRAGEFAEFVREMHRVLKPDGVASHRVDLQDHLGGSLNNLRFSDATWDGGLFRNAGFYTNRIRFGEMCRIFEEAGFDAQLVVVDKWPALPVPRGAMAARFQSLPDDDLCVRGFDVLLRKRDGGRPLS